MSLSNEVAMIKEEIGTAQGNSKKTPANSKCRIPSELSVSCNGCIFI